MKTVLITGASRGIGQAIALRLAREGGYKIALNYLENHQAATDTMTEILGLNVPCIRVQCDVGCIDSVKEMHSTIKKTLGNTDIIINNAGVARGALIQDVSSADYDYIMNTNLKGTFNVSKVFVPDMILNRYGKIVNISSVWGEVGAAYESVYSASKAGIIGLSKSLAKELAPSNITVNAIAPGAIMTDMLKQLPKSTLEGLALEIPLGRIGSVSDVASIVSYLLSEAADYITGQVINVSGGFSIS